VLHLREGWSRGASPGDEIVMRLRRAKLQWHRPSLVASKMLAAARWQVACDGVVRGGRYVGSASDQAETTADLQQTGHDAACARGLLTDP